MDRALRFLAAVLLIQIFAQQDGSGQRVYVWIFPQSQLRSHLLSFPARQPFVPELDGQSQFVAKARRESRSFLRHFALKTAQMHGRADEDCAHTVFLRQIR